MTERSCAEDGGGELACHTWLCASLQLPVSDVHQYTKTQCVDVHITAFMWVFSSSPLNTSFKLIRLFPPLTVLLLFSVLSPSCSEFIFVPSVDRFPVWSRPPSGDRLITVHLSDPGPCSLAGGQQQMSSPSTEEDPSPYSTTVKQRGVKSNQNRRIKEDVSSVQLE